MSFTLPYSVLRTMLGGVRATRNLQVDENRDLRYIVVELGFTACAHADGAGLHGIACGGGSYGGQCEGGDEC
jgi:hypothetical protein